MAAGFPWAVGVSFVALKLWAGAASDCEVFEAGARFGVTFLYWPIFAVVRRVVFDATVWLLASRSLVLGAVLGAAITVGIAYWFVAGTAEMILASGGGYYCPTGLPPWWPAWAPP